MKHILLLLLLTSCSQMQDIFYSQKAAQHHLYFKEEFLDLKTPKQISKYISQHLECSLEKDDIATWSDPKQTLELGYGTCADISLLYINILYYSTGTEASLVLVDLNSTLSHAAVEVDGVQLEPQTGELSNYTKRFTYTFQQIF